MTFERIYTLITDYAPQLAVKNTHVIHEWVAKGYDAEKDILPTIERLAKTGLKTVYSFNFFTCHIARANEKRIKEETTRIQPDEEKDAKRAEKIQWCIDKGLSTTALSKSDVEWLKQYKERKGAIA